MNDSKQKSLDVLSTGINAELAAYVFYKRAAEKVDNTEISEMLQKLAGEEKDHYWLLEREYDSMIRSEKWVTYNDLMRKNGLPEIPEEMADVHKRRLERLEATDNILEILNMALELEQKAYDYYKGQIEKFEDPAAKEMLTFLSKFELGHVNVISNWIKKL